MQGSNPLVNLLLGIVAVIVIGATIVLGFFALLALIAITLVTAAVVGARIWWARRQAPTREPFARNATGDDFIEGEFHVVKKPKHS
jgi:membrane protein implicated in regulation of membrane protease activity